MTIKTESQTTSADAHSVRQHIIKEAEECLDGLQAAWALLHGIKAMADQLADEDLEAEANAVAYSLRELALMAGPHVDNAVGGFSDAIMELKRVAPMLAARASVEANHG